MREAVTFLVKATGNRHKIIRCLNSIARQIDDRYRIIAFCSLPDLRGRMKRDYPGIEIIGVDSDEQFVQKLNACLPRIETSHVMFVNFETVVAPNAVQTVLEQGADLLVFNLARKTKKRRFAPRFPVDHALTLTEHLQQGFLLWNQAVRTDLLQKKSLRLQSFDPAMQTLLLLECVSNAENVRVLRDVLIYKDKVEAKAAPTFSQFSSNRKTIRRLARRFQKQGRTDLKGQMIMDFVISQLGSYYAERRPFAKLHKKRLLQKYAVL